MGVSMYEYINVWVYQCMGVSMCRCINVWMCCVQLLAFLTSILDSKSRELRKILNTSSHLVG